MGTDLDMMDDGDAASLTLRILTAAGGETTLRCPFGTTAASLLPRFGAEEGGGARKIVAVKANKKTLPLSARLEVNVLLEPVFLDSPEGVVIYRRSLAFLLAAAAREILPETNLYIGHSLGHSFYYTFLQGKAPDTPDISRLAAHMRTIAARDLPIRYRYMAYAEALELFRRNRQEDTALLLETRNDSKVLVNECAVAPGRDFTDLYIAPLVPRTGFLTAFELMVYEEGFLLRFPATGEGQRIEPFEDSPKIFAVYKEYKQWGRIVGVHAVGRLNRLTAGRTIREYIRIAEAFQQKKLDEIASLIALKKDTVKTVLIAGPSSSGKTTTAKRLSIALRVMGIEPIAISLDDYYLGMDQTPRDESGQPDYECLEALDVPLLNQNLVDLLAGEEAVIPQYDFKTGRRREKGGRRLRMGRNNVLVIEGIHGLNDALTPGLSRETRFKLYVSALTQLNLDDHNRIATSDNRLLRRMVRDYQFRGAAAVWTLRMWPSVQRGERCHIFPYQNSADVAFNSALDYELAVLKLYAEPLLRSVKPGEEEYAEALRLLSFLEDFSPIPPQYVPSQSILREFIGDSEFKY